MTFLIRLETSVHILLFHEYCRKFNAKFFGSRSNSSPPSTADMPVWTRAIIGLDNGLSPSRPQAMI